MNKEDKSKYETCINCGVLTDVKKNSHIDNRTTYVEGAGQLCVPCYQKIYKEESK